MNTKTFTLPTLPPSINRLYSLDYNRRRFFLSDEARKWKSDMQRLIPRFETTDDSDLRIDYVAYYQKFHKNGKRRRVDSSNLMKLTHDTVCMRWGVDDSRVVAGSFAMIDAVESRLEVTVTEL